jgi:flagellar biosynthesis protein FlhF
VVFTHLDELTHWGKLWEFLLSHDLTPLFLSSGPNIAGDFVEEVFPSVLARTFGGAGPDIAKPKADL